MKITWHNTCKWLNHKKSINFLSNNFHCQSQLGTNIKNKYWLIWGQLGGPITSHCIWPLIIKRHQERKNFQIPVLDFWEGVQFFNGIFIWAFGCPMALWYYTLHFSRLCWVSPRHREQAAPDTALASDQKLRVRKREEGREMCQWQAWDIRYFLWLPGSEWRCFLARLRLCTIGRYSVSSV